jgi:hypothetical protein
MSQAIAMDRGRSRREIVLEIGACAYANEEYELLFLGLQYIMDKGENQLNYNLAVFPC